MPHFSTALRKRGVARSIQRVGFFLETTIVETELTLPAARGVVQDRRQWVRHRASGKWAMAGALVLGIALSNMTVFITFIAFNFILHFGS